MGVIVLYEGVENPILLLFNTNSLHHRTEGGGGSSPQPPLATSEDPQWGSNRNSREGSMGSTPPAPKQHRFRQG